jgi:hypothetical protein
MGGGDESVFDPTYGGTLPGIADTSGLSGILRSLFGDGKGGLDILKLGALGGGLAGLLGSNKSSSTPSGYQGGIPKYTATRSMVTAPEAGRRPGAGGTRYGGDVTFTPKGSVPTDGGLASLVGRGLVGGTAPVDASGNPGPEIGGSWGSDRTGMPVFTPKPAPRSPDGERYDNSLPQPTKLPDFDPLFKAPMLTPEQQARSIIEETPDMYLGHMRDPMLSGLMRNPNSNTLTGVTPKQVNTSPEPRPELMREPTRAANPIQYAEAYADGGSVERYLQGGTDGMADEIPAQIGEDQPAALSHGEFVIPADVVSHLGNGNSDAGAQKLYDMMDKIRVARTGSKKQGKEIDPDKFMPGGLAKAYAEGGSVKNFNTGGLSGIGTAANAGVTGTESNLSNWVGPYVTDMLGKGQALSEMPYEQYMGPLTAGASGLQSKVIGGLQSANFPGNLGTSFSSAGAYQPPTMSMDAYKTTPIGTGPQPGATTAPQPAPMGGIQQPQQPQGIASQYMNPYLKSVLDPQLAELRRQAEINNLSGLGALTKSGAFGGGRQAIMESEVGRNLLQEQNKAIGQGYSSAYDKAMQQFNAEQAQGMGLAKLMADQGAVERGIESEGIAADKAAFEEARANPYKMVQFQQSLLSGLPLASQNINAATPSTFQQVLTGAGGVASLLNNLGLGTKKP